MRTITLFLLRRSVLLVGLLTAPAWFGQIAYAGNLENLTDNQALFLKGYEAIQSNDRATIAHIKQQLINYELYPYLVFMDIVLHLDTTPKSQVLLFLQSYPSLRLAERLKINWLKHLGKQQDWLEFNQHYQAQEHATSPLLYCYHLQSELALQTTDQAKLNAELVAFWQNNQIEPECQAVEQHLISNRLLTGSQIWHKIHRLMQNGQLNAATQSAKYLSLTEQQWVAEWQTVYHTPEKILHPLSKSIDPVVKKQIFIQAIEKLSQKQPGLAQNRLNAMAQQYGISPQQRQQINHTIRVNALEQSSPNELYDQLLHLSESQPDKMTHGLRLAIRNGHWASYLKLYKALDAEQKQLPQWLYWSAIARLNSANSATEKLQAKLALSSLAKARDYYGFLAADYLNLPYQFNAAPSQPMDLSDLVKKYPQLRMIKELIAVDWLSSAQKEWHYLLNKVDKEEFEAFSYLASDWNQHHLAIATIAQVEKWDLLQLRFPTPFESPVTQAAQTNQIEATWIYGIMRRESNFAPSVASNAGAIGLMQLMPQTAKFIGRIAGINYQERKQLTQPKMNIKLGSAYLSYLMKRFNQNQILATAAYNAGPNAVKNWIPNNEILPAQQWIESIPYIETRNYVKAVLEYTTIFESLSQKNHQRLTNRMRPIGEITQASNDTPTQKNN